LEARLRSREASMREVFGPDGFLEKCMRRFDRSTVTSDYEYRRATGDGGIGARRVQTHHHAIVEAARARENAGIPASAICSGRRVVISTATKSLQEQLYQKIFLFCRNTSRQT